MFERMIAFFREVWRKMIGTSDIKKALNADVAISNEMSTALTKWAAMYLNQASWLNDDVHSLRLPAAIASEIARAVTIEMKVDVSGSGRATFLQEQVNSILPMLREKVELGCAYGGLIMKPYVSNGKIAVDFVQADNMVPVAFDGSGRMTAVAFVDQRQAGDKYYSRLEYHRLDGTNYTIQNLAFVSSVRDQLGRQVDLSSVSDWAEIQPVTNMVNLKRPLFGYFRYPMANHIDPKSPLGVSCYSRADDAIEQADKQYSNLLWEFESGKRVIHVDSLAFDKDSRGKAVLPDRRLYRAFNQGSNVGDDIGWHEWSPDFREASILSGLDALLKKIEFQCGLAFGTISDPNSVEKTATEIAATKQRSQATVTDTQKALKLALDDLLYAMDAWVTLTPSLSATVARGTYQANYDFDDSLVVDRAAQRLEDRQDVNLGVMSKKRYLMNTRGLSEAEAAAWLAEAQGEQPAEPAFGGFGGGQQK